MSQADIGRILDDLAAGKIDTQEANRRIDEVRAADEPRHGATSGALERIQVTAVGRRVRIVGDPSVSTLSVEGPHVLRRNARTMEVNSTAEIGASFEGFSLIRPPRSLDDLRDIGLGKELSLRVNPSLVVDIELTTGALRTLDLPRLGRVRVTAGGCSIEGATEVADLLSQAGSVSVEGPISTGRSKLRVESGGLTLNLTHGANVTVRGEAKLGRISWPGDSEQVDEIAVGNGAARLDISVVMGLATIKIEDHA